MRFALSRQMFMTAIFSKIFDVVRVVRVSGAFSRSVKQDAKFAWCRTVSELVVIIRTPIFLLDHRRWRCVIRRHVIWLRARVRVACVKQSAKVVGKMVIWQTAIVC